MTTDEKGILLEAYNTIAQAMSKGEWCGDTEIELDNRRKVVIEEFCGSVTVKVHLLNFGEPKKAKAKTAEWVITRIARRPLRGPAKGYLMSTTHKNGQLKWEHPFPQNRKEITPLLFKTRNDAKTTLLDLKCKSLTDQTGENWLYVVEKMK